MSSPAKRTVPVQGVNPAMASKRVVLPAPFGPMRPTTSATPTLNDTPSTATHPAEAHGQVLDLEERAHPTGSGVRGSGATGAAMPALSSSPGSTPASLVGRGRRAIRAATASRARPIGPGQAAGQEQEDHEQAHRRHAEADGRHVHEPVDAEHHQGGHDGAADGARARRSRRRPRCAGRRPPGSSAARTARRRSRRAHRPTAAMNPDTANARSLARVGSTPRAAACGSLSRTATIVRPSGPLSTVRVTSTASRSPPSTHQVEGPLAVERDAAQLGPVQGGADAGHPVLAEQPVVGHEGEAQRGDGEEEAALAQRGQADGDRGRRASDARTRRWRAGTAARGGG